MTNVLPNASDVEEANGRLRDWLIATPVLESDVLNQRAGSRVLVKAESCNMPALSKFGAL